MWWEKKNQPQPTPPKAPVEWPVPRETPLAIEDSRPAQPITPNPSTERLEKPMSDTLLKPSTPNPANQHQTFLGGSVTLRGELNGNEDLTIEGQFEGTLNLQDHCVTIGQHGQVKADITARQVVVSGKLNGKINARDKIEIRRTGSVTGDLVSAGVAIEEGAYFKGSIEILRDEDKVAPRALGPSLAVKA